LELLEARQLLAADTFLVNFQLAGAAVPTRYAPDTGALFGNRGNGLTYGWSSDHSDVSRDRGLHPDQRLDTLIHFHQGQTWELQVPNGLYEVTAAIGDAGFESTHTLNVENVSLFNALPLLPGDFRVATRQVAVTDGRLTLDQGAAGEKATRIDYLHVVSLASGPNLAPAIPNVTEPATDGQEVNPADVHLEAVGFSDPDGNSHYSSDWEIWTVGSNARRVWQTLGVTGVERLHTHLGDGVFENSHAGRSELFADADYEVRVRFRDDGGAVSGYGTRAFRTGPASTTFPLELVDVLDVPAPRWESAAGAEIVLPPASGNVSQLRLESATGELLLSFAALNGVTNLVTNPPPLADHANLRIVLVAGDTGLNLGETDLSFSDDHGQERTVFLPAITLAAGQRVDLWVASDGSTYYGTPAQTEPNFSSLARQVSLPVPFVALEAGFKIDVVADGLQLPVNIAFVPQPGANPDDPLFYVNELYGTIKVVTNNFAVSDYATGLLNFNPTGNFPGSGEQGLSGIVVDPLSGDVIVSRVTDTDGLPGGAHHPQVLRLSSSDGGRTAASQTVILDMVGESQGQSHQISNVSIGPDGKLYVHNGDGFDAATAQNLNSYRGKVLRLNLDGTAPQDNPFYNAANGINATDYVFAYGLRNPFGGAWRASDGKHYEVENGPSVDRFAQVNEGVNYGWNGSDASMFVNAIYNWNPAHAPVNIAFTQPETFGGSQFPGSKMDRAFVSESGPTYAAGPQARGKRIVQFQLDANGNVLDGPTTFVEYVGTGRATVVGLAAGPDGLYFTDLYKDLDATSPIQAGARVYRVRYTAGGDADFDLNGQVDGGDFLAWQRGFGTNSGAQRAQGDANRDTAVNASDLDVWLGEFGAAPSAAALTARNADAAAETPVAQGPVQTVTAPPRSFASLRRTTWFDYDQFATQTPSQPAGPPDPSEQASSDQPTRFSIAQASWAALTPPAENTTHLLGRPRGGQKGLPGDPHDETARRLHQEAVFDELGAEFLHLLYWQSW
jgi:glucose/arabinose dehydrogenase